MKIGILGVGHIGKTLAQKLGAAGHHVKVANSRGPETIDPDVLTTGAVAVAAREAVSGVDVLILSVPLHRIPDVAPLLADVPADVAVIDTSNYYPMRDGVVDAIEQGQIESAWIAEQVGHPVAKAWNTIGSGSFAANGRAAGSAGRIAIPVAADDDDLRKLAMSLVEETGFTAVDAGTIAESWRQQPGAPCYCTDPTEEEIERFLAMADRERAPRRRELSVAVFAEKYDSYTANPTVEDSARVNRVLFL